MRRFTIAAICLVWLYIPAQAQTDCPLGSFGCGHEKNHEQYMKWHREPTEEQKANGVKGMHCCSEGDCRPTKAYKDDDGVWHAWDGEKYRTVPDYALLPPEYLEDGRSHLCAPKYGDLVYCFTPSQPRI